MLGRIIGIGTALSVLILIIIWQTSTPTSVGPLGILVVFILMYVSVLGALTFLIYMGSRVVSKVAKSFTVRRPILPLSLRHSYYYSSVISLGPIMLIGMQSVRNVGIYGVSLIILFVVIACVYIAKRTN